MAEPTRVKIYGERNTGTTFLRNLMNKNFEIENIIGTPLNLVEDEAKAAFTASTENLPAWARKLVRDRFAEEANRKHMRETLGWKHMSPPVSLLRKSSELTRDVLFLVTAKHPVFWALSFHRHPYHDYFDRTPDFSKFLRHPFIPTLGDNVAVPMYGSAIELYAGKVDAYRKLATLDLTMELVRYEDLVADVPAFLDALAKRHGLVRRTETVKMLDTSTKGDERTFEEFQSTYKVEHARSAVSPEDYDFIMSAFGKDRLAWLGYPE
jgi:hypothetical protein